MAVRFDASGDSLRRNATFTGVGSSGVWTICGWAKRKVDTGAFATVAYMKKTGTWENWPAETETGGDVLHAYELPAPESDLTGPTLTVDTWFFFCYSRKSNTSRDLYYGTEAGGTLTKVSNTDSRTISTDADDFWLGNDSYTEPFNGEIAYVRMWSNGLSDSEADAEWRSTTPVKSSGLQGDWRLASAATAGTDSGSNGWTLTVGGTLTDGGTDPTPPASGGGLVRRLVRYDANALASLVG